MVRWKVKVRKVTAAPVSGCDVSHSHAVGTLPRRTDARPRPSVPAPQPESPGPRGLGSRGWRVEVGKLHPHLLLQGCSGPFLSPLPEVAGTDISEPFGDASASPLSPLALTCFSAALSLTCPPPFPRYDRVPGAEGRRCRCSIRHLRPGPNSYTCVL